MKKITNNSLLSKITMLANVVVLLFFILSMIFLMKFDKTNVAVVAERSNYEKVYESYVMAQHPLKQDSAEVAYYTQKLDSLQHQVIAKTKDEKTALADAITTTKGTLSDKQKQMEVDSKNIVEKEKEYTPLNKKWEQLNADNDQAKSSFVVLAIITFVLFLVKTFFFAHWNAKNSKNLHAIAPWMKDGMPVWQSYAGWFIPVYNLLKPLTFFKEIWEETDYLLEDKSIVTVQKDKTIDNSGLHMGIWWALMLISVWGMGFILYKTFFTEGPLFVKSNHGAITIVAIIFIVLCIFAETLLLLGYNKKNKMLVDNADKFETAE